MNYEIFENALALHLSEGGDDGEHGFSDGGVGVDAFGQADDSTFVERSFSTTCTRWDTLRPRRSKRQTTRVSPERRVSKRRSSSGRLWRTPEA